MSKVNIGKKIDEFSMEITKMFLDNGGRFTTQEESKIDDLQEHLCDLLSLNTQAHVLEKRLEFMKDVLKESEESK